MNDIKQSTKTPTPYDLALAKYNAAPHPKSDHLSEEECALFPSPDRERLLARKKRRAASRLRKQAAEVAATKPGSKKKKKG